MTLTRTFTSETFRISTLWSYYSFCSRILHRQGNRKGGEGRWGRGKQSSSQSFVHIDFHWNIQYPHLPGSLQIQGFSAVLSHDSGIEFFFFFLTRLHMEPSALCAPQLFLSWVLWPSQEHCGVQFSSAFGTHRPLYLACHFSPTPSQRSFYKDIQ